MLYMIDRAFLNDSAPWANEQLGRSGACV